MSVKFDAENGLLEMKGASYPEDAIGFFEPIMQWIEQYIKEEKKPITLDIKLSYINSSSSKCFIDIFELLQEYYENNGTIKVNWYYEEDDDEIKEAGEELFEDIEFDYELVEFTEDID